MKRVLIGHRGVGKSSFLKRHQFYFQNLPHFDLDEHIADSENKSIAEIFKNQGEKYFRELEKKYFQELVASENYVIAVGGGFDVNLIPTQAEVVYISRRTDSEGRLFLNRPRLNSDLSALDESILRFKERDPKFRRKADWVYHMPEGVSDFNDVEEKMFKKDFLIEKAYFTIQKKSDLVIWKNLEKFELRSDIFSISEIKEIVDCHLDKKFIVAIRSKVNATELSQLRVDWALEFGDITKNVDAKIVSIHDGEFQTALTKINQYVQPERHLKFCPVVTNWQDLITGYEWQKVDPQNRSFLPRTEAGQKSHWRWFRILMLEKQKINFIQGLQDFDDQPSLYDYLQAKIVKMNSFGAVLGYPIHHSRSPINHAENLQDHCNILAIPIKEPDFEIAIKFLTSLGLKLAAVTSPLKLKAAELIGNSESGINTLIHHHGKWLGKSTDEDGFEVMLEDVDLKTIDKCKIILWGGAGVVSAIKAVVPEVVEYSARSGQRRDGHAINDSIEIVIWAAPRSKDIQMPPKHWKPKYIVDLNYTENSMGLEYAQSQPDAEYISGLNMFYIQAKKQMDFWFEHFGEQT